MCGDADGPDLAGHDSNLEHEHLQPLREMSDSLAPTPVLTAVRRRRSGADLQKLGTRAVGLVLTSLGGDRRVLAMRCLGFGGPPFVFGAFAEAVERLPSGEVALPRRDRHGERFFVLCGDGTYTLLDGDRRRRTPDQRPHLPTPSSAA